MPTYARTPRPRREEVRARVLEAAATVFARRGFEGATIDEVAAAAGFTKGAVYSNFANKDGLFLALLDAQIEARVQLVRGVLAAAPTGPGAAVAIGDRLARAALDDPDWQLLFLEFWQRAVREPSVRAEFVAHRRALRSSIAEAIRQAHETQATESTWSPEELTVLVLALSNGLAIETLVDPGDIPTGLFGRALARFVDEAGR